jgi:hypothetical protein
LPLGVSLSCEKCGLGPWTAYGGGGYWINPGAGNKNYSFLGAALWRKVNDRLNLGAEIFHQTSPSSGSKENPDLMSA